MIKYSLLSLPHMPTTPIIPPPPSVSPRIYDILTGKRGDNPVHKVYGKKNFPEKFLEISKKIPGKNF